MKFLKDISSYIIIVLIVVLIRTFIITPVKVNGSSMLPTLYNNDILLLYKNKSNINRFDVVVLEYNGERLVKRVVGLPGEKLKYENNKLYIDDELIKEEFTKAITENFNIESFGYETIPENSYIVLGDNRQSSRDSRYFGEINIEDVIGKTKYRIFPFNKLGIVK